MAATKNKPKTSSIHARVDSSVRQDVEKLLNSMGITMSEYINMAFYQLKIHRKIPFEVVADTTYVWLPNLDEDLEEAHQAVSNGAKTYKNSAEVKSALQALLEEDGDE